MSLLNRSASSLSSPSASSTGTPGSLSSFASGSLPLSFPALPPNWDMGFYDAHRLTSVYRDISSAPVRDVPRVRGTLCWLNTPYLKTYSLRPLVKRRSVLAPRARFVFSPRGACEGGRAGVDTGGRRQCARV